MRVFILGVLCLLCIQTYAQHTLAGLITYQNSGKKPVIGAFVKASISNGTETDSRGEFNLSIVGKRAGYEVLLKVEKAGFEVVNKKELLATLKADRSVRLKLYMCPIGQWERNALAYYEINEKVITKRYEEQVENAQKEFADQRQMLSDSLAKLAEQYKIVLNQANDLAQRFAKANLDDASELYIKAFEFFKEGKIDSAIAVLEDDLLDQQMADAQRDKKHGEELKTQGKIRDSLAQVAQFALAEDHALKGKLRLQLVPIIWQEVFQAYLNAMRIAPSHPDYRRQYVSALQQAHVARAVEDTYINQFLLDTLAQNMLPDLFPLEGEPQGPLPPKRIIPTIRRIYEHQDKREALKDYLTQYYQITAKELLYSKSLKEAAFHAQIGVSYSNEAPAPNLLLAHAFLFMNQYEEAERLYHRFRHAKAQVFKDWEALAAIGLVHRKQKKLRKELSK